MIKNLMWDMGGKLATQILSLLISLILTRLLDPEEFGVMGIAMVFIVASSVFLDMGFSRALIQETKVTQDQYSSVFYLNLLIGIILGFICFVLAGPIASFYKYSTLTSILKSLSFLFLLNSISLVPGTILSKDMKFRVISITVITSAFISGMVSVVMALHGFGVWSLVVQYLLSALITTVMYFSFSHWSPSLLLSWVSLKPLWTYGSRMFSASLLSSLIGRLDILIIGKLFNASSLGFYSRAQTFENIFRNLSTNSLTSVFFPLAARLKEERDVLIPLYFKYLHLASFFSTGLAGLLCLLAPDMFIVLFTDKWNTASSFFQLMMAAGFGWPISALMITLIAGVGNSKAFLKMEIIRMLILLPVVLFGFYAGIYSFLIIMIGVRICFLIINVLYLSKEMKISALSQFRIIGIYLAGALLAFILSTVIIFWINLSDHLFKVILLTFFYLSIILLFQMILKTRAIAEVLELWQRGIVFLRTKTRTGEK